MVPVDQFRVIDAAGVPSYAPQGLDLRTLHIDCDRGSFDAKDAELKP